MQQRLPSSSPQRRQEELEAKARELERREEQLRNAEGAAGSGGSPSFDATRVRLCSLLP